jgi:hypothetical protein
MSAELIGELQDTLSGIPIDSETHAAINELTDMLGLHYQAGKVV